MADIEFYGMIAEKLGRSSDEVEVNELLPGKDLGEWILEKYPNLMGMSFKCAVNGKLQKTYDGESIMKIAVLPPFAGG